MLQIEPAICKKVCESNLYITNLLSTVSSFSVVYKIYIINDCVPNELNSECQIERLYLFIDYITGIC